MIQTPTETERPLANRNPGTAGEHAVDIVVVSYETPELLARCLRSVAEHGGPLVAMVVVVDNSPSDRCAAVVRDQFPAVRLLRPASNVGYGSAANLGVSTCGAAAVLVLNADTELTAGAIDTLAAALVRNPAAAVVGPQLVDDGDRAQASCAAFPTVRRVLVQESGLWKILGNGAAARSWRPFTDPGESAIVPWVLGAALLVRRQPFEHVGGFDPAFFMYYEEVDLCRRLRDCGASTLFCAAARVRHTGGASTSTVAPAMQRALYRSLATYTDRHGSRVSVVGLRGAVVVVGVLRAGYDLMRGLLRREPAAALAAARTWMPVIGDAFRGWSR